MTCHQGIDPSTTNVKRLPLLHKRKTTSTESERLAEQQANNMRRWLDWSNKYYFQTGELLPAPRHLFNNQWEEAAYR